jgi:hypothetical protein
MGGRDQDDSIQNDYFFISGFGTSILTRNETRKKD